LVFIGATNDSRFRAFDSATGRLLWEQPIDANGHTIPITYLGKDGKQYVAIMAGGGGGYFGGTPSDSVMAFALGEGPAPASGAIVSRVEGGPPSGGTAVPVVLPDGPGKTLLQRRCGAACHTLSAITAVRRDRAAWAAMVDVMVARGANAKDDEVKVIVEYLVEHLEK
jgi:quinoprotein glucose dehydrogenase